MRRKTTIVNLVLCLLAAVCFVNWVGFSEAVAQDAPPAAANQENNESDANANKAKLLHDKVLKALRTKVTLTKPYPKSHKDAQAEKISVQYAVTEVLTQAGLKYNWQESYANTNPVCRKLVTPDIRNVPLRQALATILKPVNLGYEIRGDEIVLVKDVAKDPLQRKVTLVAPYPQAYKDAPTDKVSVQHAVIEIARQAGLAYDWDTSNKNAGAICRQWARPSLKNVKCGDALQQILDPVGLKFKVVDGEVVLEKK